MGNRLATVYVDYQQRAREFSVGDLAYPLAGSATDESQAGRVVQVFPGIGQVDIEFPWGSGRYPVEDVQRVTDSVTKAPDVDHTTIPGGVGTVSVPGGPEKKRAAVAWDLLEGAGLRKVQGLFRISDTAWYVLQRKIRGKSVFRRDHGVQTLYVVGADGFAYSLKGFQFSIQDINHLVDVAIVGDPEIHPRSGIYRNMRVAGSLHLAIGRVARAHVKQALYWASKNRNYRATKAEIEANKFGCPKCRAEEGADPIYLRPANYKREDGQSHRLFGCPQCLFLIKQDHILGLLDEAATDVEVGAEPQDGLQAEWDGTTDQGFESVRNVKAD